MTEKPNFFRNIVDALVAGRERTAQRFVDTYLRDHNLTPRPAPKTSR